MHNSTQVSILKTNMLLICCSIIISSFYISSSEQPFSNSKLGAYTIKVNSLLLNFFTNSMCYFVLKYLYCVLPNTLHVWRPLTRLVSGETIHKQYKTSNRKRASARVRQVMASKLEDEYQLYYYIRRRFVRLYKQLMLSKTKTDITFI